jgi:hypothetical protein
MADQPPGTSIMVLGCRAITEAADLRKQKTKEGSAGWTDAREQELVAAVSRAREGLAFIRCI